MSNSTRTFCVHHWTGEEPDQGCSRKPRARGERSAHCPPTSQTPEFGKLRYLELTQQHLLWPEIENFGGGKVNQVKVMPKLQGLCVTLRRCSEIKRGRLPPNPSAERGVNSLMSEPKYLKIGILKIRSIRRKHSPSEVLAGSLNGLLQVTLKC